MAPFFLRHCDGKDARPPRLWTGYSEIAAARKCLLLGTTSSRHDVGNSHAVSIAVSPLSVLLPDARGTTAHALGLSPVKQDCLPSESINNLLTSDTADVNKLVAILEVDCGRGRPCVVRSYSDSCCLLNHSLLSIR